MISVRLAETSDIDLVVPLFDKYRQFYGRSSDEGLARSFLSERIGRKESVIFLAEQDGMPVGFMQLYPSFTSVGAAKIWILNDLFVDPARRRNGVGSSLLESAANFARQTGAVRLVLSTAVNNLPAQDLYVRHGWARDNEFVEYALATV
jgi:ribosomal protein S18 acetylase RimI-like enzyme